MGAITSVNITSGQTSHRPGVYYVATTTTDSVAGEGAAFQVYVDAGGTVTKVVPLEFGVTYGVGDTITIPNTELGNNGGSDLVGTAFLGALEIPPTLPLARFIQGVVTNEAILIASQSSCIGVNGTSVMQPSTTTFLVFSGGLSISINLEGLRASSQYTSLSQS